MTNDVLYHLLQIIIDKLNELIELQRTENCLLRYSDYLWNNNYIKEMCGI